MTQTTQTAESKFDFASRRIDSQHDELLLKLDELDRRVEAVLAQWTSVENVATSDKRSKQ